MHLRSILDAGHPPATTVDLTWRALTNHEVAAELQLAPLPTGAREIGAVLDRHDLGEITDEQTVQALRELTR